jgi:hypothetical protein
MKLAFLHDRIVPIVLCVAVLAFGVAVCFVKSDFLITKLSSLATLVVVAATAFCPASVETGMSPRLG